MQQMEVKPPAAAAREPLSMVSACSKPGSRRCTCMSMKPGATIMPAASNASAPGEERFGATPAMRPSTMRTSAMRSVLDAGSMTRPLRMRIGMGLALSNHLFEHRHAHGDAVLHLVQNDRALEVGHLGGQLAAAVDGPGVHHDGVGFGQVHVLQAQPVEAKIFAGGEGSFVL